MSLITYIFVHNFHSFLKKIFLMWTTLKVFIEFVTVLLLLHVLVFWLGATGGLNFLTRD